MEEKNYGIVGWTYEHITKPLGRFSRKALKGVSETFKKVTKPAVDFIKKKVIDPVIINPVKERWKNWEPKTTLGWSIKNTGDKLFGPGAKEALEFENLKINITNMISKLIGILREALKAETTANGEAAIAREKKIAPAAKTSIKEASLGKEGLKEKGLGVPSAEKGALSKSGKQILTPDVGKALAEASASLAPGNGAVLMGKDALGNASKGLGVNAPDLGKQ